MKPNKLKPGDTLAIIAPSSPASQSQLAAVKSNLEGLGFNYRLLPSCQMRHGHLAGHDAARLKDLHEAFSNDEYDGILCLKGGYGTPRLLNQIDYDLVLSHPKVFIGYSDITGLHMAFNQAGLNTFHGPMASSDLSDNYTTDMLKSLITESCAYGMVHNPKGQDFATYHKGIGEGLITGGNLSLIVSTLGSPYEIDTKGKILFIEEVSEATYRLDRMLTSLALAGKFKDCAGVLLGTFSNCQPEVVQGKKEDLSLDTIIQEILVPYGMPILGNFQAGHNSPQASIPLGTRVRMDATHKTLEYMEAGVQ